MRACGPLTDSSASITLPAPFCSPDGLVHIAIADGEAIDTPILKIGNTMTHVQFDRGPSELMNQWYVLAPTHHAAMSVGLNHSLFEKVGKLLSIDFQVVSTR